MSAATVRPMPGPGVGIVGGGLLGLTVGYRLAEACPSPSTRRSGAVLAGILGGYVVDRYYHALTLTDTRVIDTARELGVRGRSPAEAGRGFFHDGRLASMSTPKELLSFPGRGAATGQRRPSPPPAAA